MSKKSIKTFLIDHKQQSVAMILILAAFVVGLIIPSPFFKRISTIEDFGSDVITVKDTTNMVLPDGSIYEGSLNAKTNAFHGYGVLKKGNLGMRKLEKWEIALRQTYYATVSI